MIKKTVGYQVPQIKRALRAGHFASTPRVIAEDMGLKLDVFTDGFNEEAGVTPTRYRKNLQLSRAQRLLRRTDLSLEKIAPICGYRDAKDLSYQFKYMTGQTIRSYRKENTPQKEEKNEKPRSRKSPLVLDNIEKVKKLLETTPLSVREIWEEIQWPQKENGLRARFCQVVGESMSAYRERVRAGSAAVHQKPPEESAQPTAA